MDSLFKTFRIQFFCKLLCMGVLLCFPIKFGISDAYNTFFSVLIQYFTQFFLILYINSIVYDHLIDVETII